MIDQGASEEILTNETESTPIEQVEKEFMPKIEDEDEDGFKGYSKFSKFLLFFLFFWINKSSWKYSCYERRPFISNRIKNEELSPSIYFGFNNFFSFNKIN